MADMLVNSTKLDACLDAEADAIRAKTGGTDPIPYDYANSKGFADAIAAIPTGGGGSGYDRKTGTFTLSSNYTYSASAKTSYNGSILIETGLSKILAVCMYSEDWANRTESNNCWGLSLCFNNGLKTSESDNDPIYYYSGTSYMKNGGNYLYYSAAPGFLLHSEIQPDIPLGSFGFRVYGSGFPIRAGHTIRWEAWGEE